MPTYDKILLPIDDVLPKIVSSLCELPNLVLTAPPGAGKSTRVPSAILAETIATLRKLNALPGNAKRVIVLQPRRLAARSIAARIADEQGWTIGRESWVSCKI